MAQQSYTFDEFQIDAFKQVWPCSGIPELHKITFTFDQRNGDLLDIEAFTGDGAIDSVEFDGPALLELSHDAQTLANGGTVDWLESE